MTEAQLKQQTALLHAIHQQDVCHLVDTIQDVGLNRWICLQIEGNERTASIRIEPDGWLTGFLGREGRTEPDQTAQGPWAPSEIIGAAVAWMEAGRWVGRADLPPCPDCSALPGQEHDDNCDVERCSGCKKQRLACVMCGDCGRHDPALARWEGEHPGVKECRERGWYAVLIPYKGWHPCGPDTKDATEDLNRWSYFAQTGRDEWYVRQTEWHDTERGTR